MNLSPHQIDTILAALRLWQQNLDHQHEFLDQNLIDIATNNGDHEQLDSTEIDELCENLNFAATVEVSDE